MYPLNTWAPCAVSMGVNIGLRRWCSSSLPNWRLCISSLLSTFDDELFNLLSNTWIARPPLWFLMLLHGISPCFGVPWCRQWQIVLLHIGNLLPPNRCINNSYKYSIQNIPILVYMFFFSYSTYFINCGFALYILMNSMFENNYPTNGNNSSQDFVACNANTPHPMYGCGYTLTSHFTFQYVKKNELQNCSRAPLPMGGNRPKIMHQPLLVAKWTSIPPFKAVE